MRLRSKPVNVHVELGGKIRTVEQLIRAFKKAVKEDGILKECKDRVRNYRTSMFFIYQKQKCSSLYQNKKYFTYRIRRW